MTHYTSPHQFAVDTPHIPLIPKKVNADHQSGLFHNETIGSPSWFRPMQWAAIAKERRALQKLDANQLRDIGVSKFEATMESNKYWWDVPQHWHN